MRPSQNPAKASMTAFAGFCEGLIFGECFSAPPETMLEYKVSVNDVLALNT